MIKIKKRVLIVGAGGIGSHLIPMIKSDDVLITVMDGDKYEKKNLERQNITLRDLRKNKAVAMVEKYGLHEAIQHYAKSTSDFIHDDQVFDMVICVPDNHTCRLLAIEASNKCGFGLILAGNETTTANAMYYHPKMMGSNADPKIKYPEMLASAIVEGQNSCSDVQAKLGTQTMLANIVAATMTASLLNTWLNSAMTDSLAKQYGPVEHTWAGSNYETRRGYDYDK